MTDDIVARARAALEGVTAGPWSYHDIGNAAAQEPTSIVVHTGKFDWDDLMRGEAGSAVAWMPRWGRQESDNAAFIAQSPELVADMADEIEKLREVLEDRALDVDATYERQACKIRAIEAERDQLKAAVERVRALAEHPTTVPVHAGGGNLVSRVVMVNPSEILAALAGDDGKVEA